MLFMMVLMIGFIVLIVYAAIEIYDEFEDNQDFERRARTVERKIE